MRRFLAYLFFVSYYIVIFTPIFMINMDIEQRFVSSSNEPLKIEKQGKPYKGEKLHIYLKDTRGNIAARSHAYDYAPRVFSHCPEDSCFILIYGKEAYAKEIFKVTPQPPTLRSAETPEMENYGLQREANEAFLAESIFIPFLQSPYFLIYAAFFFFLFALPLQKSLGGSVYGFLWTRIFTVKTHKYSFGNPLRPVIAPAILSIFASSLITPGIPYHSALAVLALFCLLTFVAHRKSSLFGRIAPAR